MLQTQTTATCKSKIIERIKKDIATAQNFLKMCRYYILESDANEDQETLSFWVNQQDTTLQHLQLLNWQLKHTK